MHLVFTSIMPVFIVILLGMLIKRYHFSDATFWASLEKITYFILFPCLLISNIAQAQIDFKAIWQLSAVMMGSLLLLALLLVLLQPYLRVTGAVFSSIFQGSLRFNSYVGVALALLLLPEHGVMLSAVMVVSMVPLLNVLCTAVLAHYASHQALNWQRIGWALLQNPLILGCVIGLVINVSNTPLPTVIAEILSILGRATLPLGLLAVGAALQFRDTHQHGVAIVVTCIGKFVLLPILVLAGCTWLQLPPIYTYTALLFAALPTATSAYILARQMAGDATLMATLISLQTLLSMLSLPLWLSLLA